MSMLALKLSESYSRILSSAQVLCLFTGVDSVPIKFAIESFIYLKTFDESCLQFTRNISCFWIKVYSVINWYF